MNAKIVVIWIIKFPLAWLVLFIILAAIIGEPDLMALDQGLAWLYVLSMLLIPAYLAIRYARGATKKVRDNIASKVEEDADRIRLKQLDLDEKQLKIEKNKLALEEKEAKHKREAKEKELMEKNNLNSIKNELDKLGADIEESQALLLERSKKKYVSIIKKVAQEQESLRDLTERHPLISSFLESRNMDDLDSKVFLELKAKLGNNP
jgi:hypothetical protein|tara:strand:+ start:485 stop:1105 length:621 start_codon:yes stop_codon:yes gene_type:complete